MIDPAERASEQHHHDLGAGGRPRSMSVRDVLGPSTPSPLRRAARSIGARPAAALRVVAGVAGLAIIALTYVLVADAVVGSPSAFGEQPGAIRADAVLDRAEPWADRLGSTGSTVEPGAAGSPSSSSPSAMATPGVPAPGSAATVPAVTGAAATAPVSPGAPPAGATPAGVTSATVPAPAAIQAVPQAAPLTQPTLLEDDGGHGGDDGSGRNGSDDSADDRADDRADDSGGRGGRGGDD